MMSFGNLTTIQKELCGACPLDVIRKCQFFFMKRGECKRREKNTKNINYLEGKCKCGKKKPHTTIKLNENETGCLNCGHINTISNGEGIK